MGKNKSRRGGFHIRPCPFAAEHTSAGAYRMRPYGSLFLSGAQRRSPQNLLFIIFYLLSAHLLLIALTKALMPATIISVWVPQPQVSSPEAHFKPT